MGSRIRDNPEKIFECFLEIVGPTDASKDPWILQKYPDSFKKEEVLKAVSQFAYPCDIESNTVQHFSFVLTNIDSRWTFGYCRHAPAASTCLCILSFLPWHDTFYKLLDRIAEVTRAGEAADLSSFLGSVHGTLVPLPGSSLRVLYDDGTKLFECFCSDHRKLPSFPENRNLNEYYNAVDVNNMILIFASMLNERRVVITSSKLGRLSACVQAASALIYPMHWQHIFIPVLPIHLLDYLSAPMPFLVGVPASVFERAKRSEMGDAVILYADSNTCESPFDDLQSLPLEITSGLKRKLRNTESLRGDGIARAFLHALVQLIGGYRGALTFRDGERISFCRETFLQTRPNNMQPYLERLLQLQIFQQFIEERLDMLNSGKIFNDVFEEVSLEMDKSGAKFKTQYKDWMGNMKKEGGALFRNMKSKANPAVKHAYKHMKDRSRKAYKEVRSMFQEPMMQDVNYPPPPPSSLSSVAKTRPRSAPSSPTNLVRSTSLHGIKLSRGSGHQRSVVSYVRPREGVTRRTVNGRIDLIKKTNQYCPLDTRTTPQDAQLPPLPLPPPALATAVIQRKDSSDSLDDQRSSSPDLSVQRINMDLMGDLQDLIFRRCSLDADRDSVKEVEGTSSPSSLLPGGGGSGSFDRILKSSLSPTITSTSPAHVGTSLAFLSPPIPPPRSKRPYHGVASDETKESSKDTHTEVPLIRLDSEESEDVVFDPLLSKDNLPTASSVFQLPQQGLIPIQAQPSSTTKAIPPSQLHQRYTVSVQNPSNVFTTTPLSPGLNNPVYFHVSPVVQAFQTPIPSNSVPATNIPSSSTFPVYQRNMYSGPFSADHLISQSVAGSDGNDRQDSAVSPSNLLNNNQPMNLGQIRVNLGDRFSALKPQESFLHSRMASTSSSVSERTKLFENLDVLDRVSSAAAPKQSTVEQRREWQTFD